MIDNSKILNSFLPINFDIEKQILHNKKLELELLDISLPVMFLAMGLIIFSNILSNTHINILKSSFIYSQTNIIILSICTKFALYIIVLILTLILNLHVRFSYRFYISLTLIIFIACVHLIEILLFVDNHEAILTTIDPDIFMFKNLNNKTELLIPFEAKDDIVEDKEIILKNSFSNLHEVKEKSRF